MEILVLATWTTMDPKFRRFTYSSFSITFGTKNTAKKNQSVRSMSNFARLCSPNYEGWVCYFFPDNQWDSNTVPERSSWSSMSWPDAPGLGRYLSLFHEGEISVLCREKQAQGTAFKFHILGQGQLQRLSPSGPIPN